MSATKNAPWTGHVPIDSVVPNPDQPRKWFDEEDLARAAASIARAQIQPVMVIPWSVQRKPEIKWLIVDGERRWRALKKLGRKEVLVCVNPEVTEDNLHAASFAANFCRTGHTHAETAQAIERERAAGRSLEDIGASIGKSSSWVCNKHKLLKLHPDLLKAMDPPTQRNQRLREKLALLLADLPPFDQLKAWKKVKDMSADAAFHKLRTKVGVSASAGRKPSDDRAYVFGKVRNATKQLETLRDLPLPMLKRLSEDDIEDMFSALIRSGNCISECRQRLISIQKEAA